MALTFIGETEFVQSGQPQWQQSMWDLDNLIIPFSGAEPNLNSFLDGLVVGQPSDIDPDMLLVDWRVGGSKAYPSVDLVYLGKKNGILPATKHEQGHSVQSSSSIRSQTQTLSEALTVEYYAPTSTISYLSAGAPGTAVASDPVRNPTVITLTEGDTTYSIGTVIQDIVNTFFVVQIVESSESQELVPVSQYWQNTSRKTKVLSPWVFDLTAGAYVVLYSGGRNYSLSDTLSITGTSGSASITLTDVTPVSGEIINFTVGSNTFTAEETGLYAIGGSGTNARFSVFVIA